MTSTGLVGRRIPCTYLLIIVARVMATTKCKPVRNCRRPRQRSSTAPPNKTDSVVARIHQMRQANCAKPRRTSIHRPRRTASSAARASHRATGASRESIEKLLCCRRSRSLRDIAFVQAWRPGDQTDGRPDCGYLGRNARRPGQHLPTPLFRARAACAAEVSRTAVVVARESQLRGEQHRQDGGVGMADGIDAHAADHRGDCAVGFGFHPGRPVLESQIWQPG